MLEISPKYGHLDACVYTPGCAESSKLATFDYSSCTRDVQGQLWSYKIGIGGHSGNDRSHMLETGGAMGIQMFESKSGPFGGHVVSHQGSRARVPIFLQH